MNREFLSLPVKKVQVDTADSQGEFAWWRHRIGHGGINSLPLPDRVVAGARKLKPRLLRTFIQEYFYIYPEHGRFDWSRLDPYMESLAATGTSVVAAITDVLADVEFKNVSPERKMLTVFRIDGKQRWSGEELELIPIEQRINAYFKRYSKLK